MEPSTDDPGDDIDRDRVTLAAAFRMLVAAFNALGSVWVFFIMALVCADVVARYVFNSPITGVPLTITMSLIAIVFLQLPDALKAGRVTRNEALLSVVLERWPRAGYALEAFFHLSGAAMMAFLVLYIAPMFAKAWQTDAFLGTRSNFTLPEWPFKLVIVVGAVMTALQFLLLFWRDLRRCMDRSANADSNDSGEAP